MRSHPFVHQLFPSASKERWPTFFFTSLNSKGSTSMSNTASNSQPRGPMRKTQEYCLSCMRMVTRLHSFPMQGGGRMCGTGGCSVERKVARVPCSNVRRPTLSGRSPEVTEEHQKVHAQVRVGAVHPTWPCSPKDSTLVAVTTTASPLSILL